MLSLRKITGKKLLSFVRGGDFAHAGEIEAINLLMAQFKKKSSQYILDVGCGLGGTAHYLQEQAWGQVFAFDIEKEAIAYAKETYPKISFYESDVCNIHNVITDMKFDIFCLFNVFYAFSKQDHALESLRKIANKNGVIAIFDYSDPTPDDQITPCLNYNNEKINPDFPFNAPFIPIKPTKIETLLSSNGWALTSMSDISDQYEKWYDTLVTRITNKKSDIIKNYGIDAYLRSYDLYSKMLLGIKQKLLGGIIVYAKAI